MLSSAEKDAKKNGEVVMGDMEYDGRVILYIIKGAGAIASY